MTATVNETSVLTPAVLLEHWKGHRRLTRRVIETFPEDKLFSFSVASMRPFPKWRWSSSRWLNLLCEALRQENGLAKTICRRRAPKQNCSRSEMRRRRQSIRSGPRFHRIVLRKWTWRSGSGKVRASERFCTRSTTRSIIAVRRMFICERLGSNRPRFMTGIERSFRVRGQRASSPSAHTEADKLIRRYAEVPAVLENRLPPHLKDIICK